MSSTVTLSDEEKKARKRVYDKEYYWQNREKKLAYHKEWTANNRGKRAATGRKFRATHANSVNADVREKRRKHPDKIRDAKLKQLYGITLEQRNAILVSQGSVCAICKTDSPGDKDWHTDHCHTTSGVRGVLCRSCNLMLGLARDNPAVLITGAEYLRSFENGKAEADAVGRGAPN